MVYPAISLVTLLLLRMYISLLGIPMYSSGVVYPTSIPPGPNHCARLKEGVLAATSGVTSCKESPIKMHVFVDLHGWLIFMVNLRCKNIPYMDPMTSDSSRKQQVRSGIWWKKSCSICVMKPSAKVGTNILFNWLARFLPWTGSLHKAAETP